jgi:hypothetical protein
MTEIRNLNDLAEYAHAQLQRLEQMHRDLAEYVGQAHSPRGHVHARTGPGGALLDLHIEPGALRLTADDLAAEIKAAVTAAQHDYTRRADDIMAPILAMRPSEQAAATIEQGISRLDTLTTDLERLAQRRNLTD